MADSYWERSLGKRVSRRRGLSAMGAAAASTASARNGLTTMVSCFIEDAKPQADQNQPPVIGSDAPVI